jgi:hypothetical protein
MVFLDRTPYILVEKYKIFESICRFYLLWSWRQHTPRKFFTYPSNLLLISEVRNLDGSVISKFALIVINRNFLSGHYKVRFETLKVVNTKVAVLWDMTPCNHTEWYKYIERYNLKMEVNLFWNSGTFLSDYVAPIPDDNILLRIIKIPMWLKTFIFLFIF